MKVTNDILAFWRKQLEIRKLSTSTLKILINRTFNLITILKLDYHYDGLDFYMDTENLQQLFLGIESYFDYKENAQDYLTTLELVSFIRKHYKTMPHACFRVNSRTPYDVLEEDKYKIIFQIEYELESIGFKPVTFAHGGAIFKKSDINTAKNSLVTTDDISEILQKEHKLSISKKGLYSIFSNEEYNTQYNFDSLRIKCFPEKYVFKKDVLHPIKQILEERAIDSTDYYNIDTCCEMLDISRDVARRCILSNVIKSECHTNGKRKTFKIPISEVERWKLFKLENTALSEFIETTLRKEIDEGIIKKDNLIRVLRSKNFFGCKLTPVIDTPFDKLGLFYINNNDLDYMRKKINEYMEEFKYKKLSREEKIEYSLASIDAKLKNTKEDIENLIYDKLDVQSGKEMFGWLDCTRVLGQTLEKELFSYNNEEIKKLISKVNSLVKSKIAKEFLTELLQRTKSNTNCEFDCDFIFDDNNIVPSDTSPYTMEQMGRLSILVFNETHPDFKKRLQHSIRYRGSAGCWLYIALHYVCSWRRGDMENKLPRITLPTKDYNEFFELLKQDKISDDMAISIATELEDIVSVLNLEPTKTEETTNQELILDIPESAKRIIGILLGLCEAHVQKYEYENPGKTINYIPRTTTTFRPFKSLFGDEYVDIFGECIFNNTRANRFYLINIAEIAEKEGLGTGYIIASLARAHKFTLNEKSNTTQIYLRYFKNLTDSDILLKELFERGVCSFIPYLALKMASGEDEIKKLSLSEQTNLIKKLPQPLDIEDSLKELNEVLDICKDDLNKLIQIFGEKDNIKWEDEVKIFVSNLAGKGSNGKTKGTKCILRALGKECNKLCRDNCIGCGEEIYLKSTFHILGERFRFFADKMKNSKTKASAVKYKFILEQVLKPIVKNIRVYLKEIYKVDDISTFKLIYDGKYTGEEGNVTRL